MAHINPLSEIDEFRQLPERAAAFYALGRYVSVCSLIESTVHGILKYWLGIEENLVRMLVKETRMGELCDFLQQTAEHRAVGKERLQALDLIKQQIIYLNKVRAVVAHKPFGMKDGQMVFSNTMTAPKIAMIYQYRCTPEQLLNGSLFGAMVANTIIGLSDQESKPTEHLAEVRTLHALLGKPTLPGSPDRTSEKTGVGLVRPRPSRA